MTEEQIKRMAERFLQWKLPANFHPDAGITFTPEFNVEWNAKRGLPPDRHEPTGTNLWGYTEAVEMVRHMVAGLDEAHDATKAEFEAFKRDVSEAVKALVDKAERHSATIGTLVGAAMDRFILPEPVDPLVEAVASINDEMIRRIADSKDVASCRNAIRAALIACGLTITEQNP